MKRTFSQTLLKQGIAASKAGQRQEAREMLLQVVELDPDNEAAWLWLSGVVDSREERRHCLEQVLRLNPQHPHARAGLAWLEEQGAAVSPALDEQPVDVYATAQAVEAEDVCPFCDNAISAKSIYCPHCQHDLVVVCPLCEARVDIQASRCSICGHELGDYRQGAAYYAALGKAYLDNLKTDLAIAAWEQVLEMDPGYPDAYLHLGEAQMMAGDLAAANDSFERAIRHASNPASAYLGLGRMCERRQKWEEAEKAYEQAVKADASWAPARFALGRLLMEGNAFQRAFPHVRQATELAPRHAGSWYLLGRLYELAQERGKAIRAFERAIALAKRGIPGSDKPGEQAAERLERLRPSLPPSVALNWPETVRQTAGMAVIPVLAALVNAGLRPWRMAPLDFMAALVAVLGAYFLISALVLPRNPGMRAMLGPAGLSDPPFRWTVGGFGGLFWMIGLLYILLAPLLL